MTGPYATIVADPPWPYGSVAALGATSKNRPNSFDTPGAKAGAANRYSLMSMADIKRIKVDAADDAHLYLWTTNAFMAEAHEVMAAWGFEQKTILTWVKMKPDGTPSMKMGYYFRGATEHCLFGVRGRLRLRATRALPTAFLWPRLDRHSEKPDSFYDLVEEASPGPYLELFARRQRLGWDTIGDELGSTLEVEPPTRSTPYRSEDGILA